jgi:signal transduction histidine kinase
MPEPVRILHLEDDAADAELAASLLESDGLACAPIRVASREEFVARLDKGGFDLIITDFSLPGFDGHSALSLAREKCPHIPCIFVSGVAGEETAIAALQAGAVDYVLKTNMARLAPAVRRALREARDARERLSLQEDKIQLTAQFLQAQKMEAVGLLAAGIAHDFNNVLTAIIGYNYFLLEGLGKGHPLHECCLEIQRVAETAAAFNHQLLALGRIEGGQARVLEPNSAILTMAKMLRRIVGDNIKLEVKTDPALWPVKMDNGHVEQIVLNLAVNGRDAMPKGGELFLSTKNVMAGPERGPDRRISPPPGAYVCLEIRDTGIGMDAAVQERIFEPFFTTKEPGRGTGLGLSTVRSIVKLYQGHIEVESEPGRGSTFRVYLPRAEGAAQVLPPASAGTAGKGAGETILVVEDHDPLRDIIQKALSREGYQVFAAANGDAALELCRKIRGGPDLLLLDMVLPDCDGTDLAQRLSGIRPDLKTVCMSGYPEGGPGHVCGLAAGGFIEKPFSPEQLIQTVRRALGAARV